MSNLWKITVLCSAVLLTACNEDNVHNVSSSAEPSCKDACTKDVCDGKGAYQKCEDTNGNGCKELSESIACQDGTTCQKGICKPNDDNTCEDTCTTDVCDGDNAYKVCEDADGDGCKELSNAKPCGSGMTCSDGACRPDNNPECKDACTSNICDGDNAYKVCEDADGDGCKELSDAKPCDNGKICSDGACKKPEPTVCKYTELKDAPTSFHAMPQMGKGRIEQVTITTDEAGNPYGKTFHDTYLISPDGRFKVGVRKEYGGAITFLGKAGDAPGHNRTNVIDSNDTGRMVQVALYDGARIHQGCAYDASCRDENPRPNCPEDMNHMGWNPVQGGNRCDITISADKIEARDGEIFTSIVPLTWNPYWDLPNCPDPRDACSDPNYSTRTGDLRVDQTLRWVGTNTVEILHVIHNLSDLAHPASTHEFPTMYTAFGGHGLQNIYRLFDSNQKEITHTTQCDINCVKVQFTSPKNWVSLQNADKTWGVGILYEGATTECQGWKFTNTANRGNCMSRFAIPARGSVVARSYLIIGSLGDVNLVATDLLQKLKPFGVLDTPSESHPAKTTGKTHVSGWALDNTGVKKITVSIDEGEEVEMNYGNDRSDVVKVYPNWSGGSTQVGYTGEISFEGLDKNCQHLLTVYATDTDGNKAVIAKRLVSIQ